MRRRADNPFCVREIRRKLLHGPLLPNSNRERLIIGGEEDDIIHVFLGCKRLREVWGWTRKLILKFLPSGWSNLSDFELLYLCWPPYLKENDVTITWILSQYTSYIWVQERVSLVPIKLLPYLGYLSAKYKSHYTSRRPRLLPIVFDPG